jgi:NADH dehydrogenase
MAVTAGQALDNFVVDSAGPEILTFGELVRLLAREIGSRAAFIHVPPSVALAFVRLIGWIKRDVILTREELLGLMADLLVSRRTPQGRARFSGWLKSTADRLGLTYRYELKRHFL